MLNYNDKLMKDFGGSLEKAYKANSFTDPANDDKKHLESFDAREKIFTKVVAN